MLVAPAAFAAGIDTRAVIANESALKVANAALKVFFILNCLSDYL